MSKSLTDMERARQRAVMLGFTSVTALLAARMKSDPDSANVRALRNVLSRGLRSRRSMVTAAKLFDVPPTFWLETDPVRVRAMIDAPAASTTAAAA